MGLKKNSHSEAKGWNAFLVTAYFAHPSRAKSMHMKDPMLPAYKTQRKRVVYGSVGRCSSSKVATRPSLPSVQKRLPGNPLGAEISILSSVMIEISGFASRYFASDRHQDDTDGHEAEVSIPIEILDGKEHIGFERTRTHTLMRHGAGSARR